LHFKWIVLGICCLTSLYVSGTIQIGFTSFIEPLVQEFDWSYTHISLAASLRGLETGLMVPIAGIIMDRWGLHRMIFVGALIGGIGMILLSRVHSLSIFYSSFIVLSVCSSSTSTTLIMAHVSRWFERNAGLAMGIAASGVAFGGILLPVITHLIDSYGWRHTAIVMAFGMWFFVMPLSCLLGRQPNIGHGHSPSEQKEAPGTTTDAEIPTTAMKNISITLLVKSRPFWIISGAMVCHVLTTTAIVTHIMPYLGSIHFDRTAASFITSIIPVITILGRVGFGWMADRFNKRNIIILALALTGCASALLSFVTPERIWIVAVFAVMLGVGWGGGVPITPAIMIAYFGKEHIGTLLGFMGGLMTTGAVMGAPLAGWIFDNFNDYSPAWILTSMLMALATISIIWLLPPIVKLEG
jgi:MFS family permease